MSRVIDQQNTSTTALPTELQRVTQLKCVSKKIGLELYLWLHFNFLTRKPIPIVQITYLWLNEDISAQNYLLCEFFLWNGQKILWCKSCSFFGIHFLNLLILIWLKPSFEIKFDQFGQVIMLFWCEGGSHPLCTWQGFQRSHLLGLNEKNSTAKIWQISLTKFFTKIVFF